MKLLKSWSVSTKSILAISAVSITCAAYVNCAEPLDQAALQAGSSSSSSSNNSGASQSLSQQSTIHNYQKSPTATNWNHLVEVDSVGDVYVTSSSYNVNLSPATHTFSRQKIDDGGCFVDTKSGIIVSNNVAFTTYRLACLDKANGEIYFFHFAYFPNDSKWSALNYHGGVTFQEFSPRTAYGHLFQPTPDTGTNWGYISRRARDGSGAVEIINVMASPGLAPEVDSWNTSVSSGCIPSQRQGQIVSNGLNFTSNHSACLSLNGSELSFNHWISFANGNTSNTIQHGVSSLL